MTFRVVFVLVSILWALIVADNTTSDSTTATTAKPVISVTTMNSSLVVNKTNNSKMPHEKGRGSLGFDVDSSTIQRALYVLIGITVIGVLYFLVRAVRLKKPTVTKRKKYGLLSNQDDDNMEMGALDSDEDDTVYEARALRR
ncbi:protein FAM174C [Clupea harengus]|uniref:Protein FAM174C n=1 Tax=Clupea harengus TaxID=7950 RepID=A0A6P3VQZ4_CLUHA|nr:protein FAM174C [Clupea harengus]